MTLWGNGKLIGEGTMPSTVPVMFSSHGGTDVGHHNGLVVDRAYEDRPPRLYRQGEAGRLRREPGSSAAIKR